MRHARLVSAVARAGSISRAALLLGLPQPSVTAQLRRIERSLGGPLFVRSRSGVEPTPFGEMFIPLLADLAKRADAVLARLGERTVRRLRLGNIGPTGPDFHAAVSRAFPEHLVRTVSMEPAAAVRALAEGLLDAAVVRELPAGGPIDGTAQLGASQVVREPFWVLAPAGHPLAGQPHVRLSQLAAQRWIRRGLGGPYAELEDRIFHTIGHFEPEVVHHAASYQETADWVRRGDVLALVPPRHHGEGVCLIPLADAPWSGLKLLWQPHSVDEASARALLRLVRGHYCLAARACPRYWAWIRDHPQRFEELAGFLDDVPVPEQQPPGAAALSGPAEAPQAQ